MSKILLSTKLGSLHPIIFVIRELIDRDWSYRISHIPQEANLYVEWPRHTRTTSI